MDETYYFVIAGDDATPERFPTFERAETFALRASEYLGSALVRLGRSGDAEYVATYRRGEKI